MDEEDMDMKNRLERTQQGDMWGRELNKKTCAPNRNGVGGEVTI